MMTDKEEIWILKGYETFALHGDTGLKAEQLAKAVGISKSSFYHHFADMDFFLEKLMKQHLAASSIIAAKEKAAKTINPELIGILLDHKTDLLFNRQLRINSHKPLYRDTLLSSNQIIGNEFIHLWLSDTKLQITPKQAEGLFTLALENFFLQLNPANIRKEWLENYFEELKRISLHFESPLYGSV